MRQFVVLWEHSHTSLVRTGVIWFELTFESEEVALSLCKYLHDDMIFYLSFFAKLKGTPFPFEQ